MYQGTFSARGVAKIIRAPISPQLSVVSNLRFSSISTPSINNHRQKAKMETFDRFLDLPRELQLLIWHHAAHPLGTSAMLGDPFLLHMSDERFGHHESYSPGFFHWMSSAKFLVCDKTRSDRGEMARARAVLRATCRMSRMVVLEVWREEVRIIPCGGEFGWFREAVKREILGLLEGLIEGL